VFCAPGWRRRAPRDFGRAPVHVTDEPVHKTLEFLREEN
jgi:hypothetical protein